METSGEQRILSHSNRHILLLAMFNSAQHRHSLPYIQYTRSADKYSRVFFLVDVRLHVALEAELLPTEVVSVYHDVQLAQKLLSILFLVVRVLGDEDHARTRPEYRPILCDPLLQRFDQFPLFCDQRYCGTLPSRYYQPIDLSQFVWVADLHRADAEFLQAVDVFCERPLQSQHADRHARVRRRHVVGIWNERGGAEAAEGT
mmetsp:Transcript_3372/g.6317  ORF Transcript_3372/g.6317 Transcript_3372/m.6317 type:complete len:202 (+) Transcript_3372:319-924(+)